MSNANTSTNPAKLRKQQQRQVKQQADAKRQAQNQKTRQKQAVQRMQPFPSVRKERPAPSSVLSPLLREVAHQIIDPGNVVEVRNTPCPSTAYVTAKRFTRIVDYQLNGLDNSFSIMMSPNLLMPGLITSGEDGVYPPQAAGLTYIGKLNCTGSNAAVNPGNVTSTGFFHSEGFAQHGSLTHPITDSAGLTYTGFLLTGPAVGDGGGFSCDFDNNTLNEIRIQCFYKVPAGIWTSMISAAIPGKGSAYVNTTLPAHSAIAWRCLSPSAEQNIVDVKMGLRVSQLTTRKGIDFAPAFTKQLIDKEVSTGRVISMRFTATNTSNLLGRSGNVTAARVPPYFNPFNSSVGIANNASRLPPNRVYTGPAEHGCSVFWMPEQLDEWSVDNIYIQENIYQDSSFLLAHFGGLTAESSFRIKFSWLVEFYTPTQLFGPSLTPDWSPEWEEVCRLLVALDAATCNPDSAGMFERFLRSGQGYLRQAKDHYNMHQGSYAKLYQLLQTLGPLLAG